MEVINGVDRITKNNMPFKPMYGFKGKYCFIEQEYINTVEHKVYLDYASEETIDVLLIELSNGVKISIDCESAEDAKEQVKNFKKEKIKVV